MRSMRLLVCVTALFALAGRPAWAQIGGGEINGLVTDAQSAAVPGATVTATNTATGVTRTTTSTNSGGCAVSGLPPGVYTVDVMLSGFRSVRHEGVRVQTGVTIRLDIALMVGDVSEAITVTAATPALRASASLGQVVSEEKVSSLPLNGRSFVTLITLVPAVALTPGQAFPRINGGRPRTNGCTFSTGFRCCSPSPAKWRSSRSWMPFRNSRSKPTARRRNSAGSTAAWST